MGGGQGGGRDWGGGGEAASTLTVTTLGKMTLSTGNTNGITVLLTSCLTVLESAV